MKLCNKKNILIAVLLLVVVIESIGLGVLALRQNGPAGPSPLPDDLQAAEPSSTPSPEPEATLETDPPQEGQTPPAGDSVPPEDNLSAAEILSVSPVVSHAMGAIDDVSVLNCLEGFEAQYAQGVRVFEVDLRLTYDLQVVLRHDWRAGWQEGVSETAVPTLEEFLSKPLLGQYTPLSFRDLLLLMEKYPDICVITDTKFTDAEVVTLQFEAMLRDAEELGLSHLFDRMVIQVYSPLMFKIVNNIHPFPNYIYTLYAIGFGGTPEAFEEIALFCRDNGISGVTMWYYWWNASYAPIAQQYEISVYTHTVDDAPLARTLLSEGVSAVYTNCLVPDDFE